MIIGNKSDMDDRRVVGIEKGQDIAKNHNIPFYETSAKSNINIDKAFYEMSKIILDKQPEKKPNTQDFNKNSTTIQPSLESRNNLGTQTCCWSSIKQ